MQLSTFCFCVLTVVSVAVSADHPVTVKLHGSATLSCSERCSGLVRWTVFSKPKDTLAECDQTSCRSVKEGYQMIHHQYLNGDLSLTITDADFSKRGLYTCKCGGKDLCDVHLKIEPLNTTVQIQTGESLVLKWDIPEDVEVLYSSAGASSVQICTVDGRSLQCTPEYTQRVSAAVTLRGVTPSDSGVYTIKDKLNEEVIHTYTVSVQGNGSEAQSQIQKSPGTRRSAPSGCPPCVCEDQGAALPGWVVPVLAVLVVLVVVLLGVCVFSVRMFLWQRSENQQLQKEPGRNGDTNHVQNGVQMNALGNNGAGEQQRLAQTDTHQETV